MRYALLLTGYFTLALIAALFFGHRAWHSRKIHWRLFSVGMVAALLALMNHLARLINWWLSDDFRFILVSALLFASALVLLWWAWRGWRHGWRRGWIVARWQGRLTAVLLALAGLVMGGVLVWYTHRPLPSPIAGVEIFQGITYTREIRHDPRPLVIHVLTIDLDAPGLRVLVTPGEPDVWGDPPDHRQLKARTVSEFVAEFGVQVAINGGYFEPWHNNFPLNYYPHSGDPVDVRGYASSMGVVYSEGREPVGKETEQHTLFISADNRVSFDEPIGEVYNAISGGVILFTEGVRPKKRYNPEPEPRTAVAVDRTGRKLILMVVDGRQPNFSEGVNLPELIDLLMEFGGYTALNMDGGGSSTMVMAQANRDSLVLNSPIQMGIPGLERPVANHLGVYALPIQE